MNIYEEIKEILIKEMEIELDDSISENASFRDELDIDSLEKVELATSINSKFKLNIPLDKIIQCDTIFDLIQCIEDIENRRK